MPTFPSTTVGRCNRIAKNAKRVVKQYGLNQDWNIFERFILNIYQDFPQPSDGSRAFLFERINEAVESEQVEYLIQIQAALAFAAYKYGHHHDFTKRKPDQAETLYIYFAWWADIYDEFCALTGLGKAVEIHPS
jgi:hypothetical protein